MEDGGQNVQARAAAAAAAKKEKNKNKNEAITSSREPPRYAVPFRQMPGITGVLRDRLEALGATEPSFVIGKSLAMSDVNHEQARLLFSCKGESLSLSPITAVFTKTEKEFVGDKLGLLVTAFDSAGRSYDLTCKYLVSNAGYRFITAWKPYVIDNGLGVAVRVELWWFRSRKLHNRYELRQGEDGKEKKVPVMVESGHPDGSLGLVLLHYDNHLLEPEQAAVDEPNEAPPVQETEIGYMGSKTTTSTAEDKLADGECAEPMIRERNIVISREDVFNAAIGLLELRRYYSGGDGSGGEEGGGGGGGEPES